MKEIEVCFVAAPLAARTGVYRSCEQLVEWARSSGRNWRAVVGTRQDTGLSEDGTTVEPWVDEVRLDGANPLRRYLSAYQLISTHEWITDARVVVTLIPFSDITFARFRRRHTWIVWLRGLPWPAENEAGWLRRRAWRALEVRATKKAAEVWATTPLLASQVDGSVTIDAIVPAGVAPVTRAETGPLLVWAGRYAIDKDPDLFLETMRLLPEMRGAMYGSGKEDARLVDQSPPNVDVAGWRPADALWRGTSLFLGTSTREAFGRSAVEAALSGRPVLLRAGYGCGEFLYTDPKLRDIMILESGEPSVWADRVRRLMSDRALYDEVTAHVTLNAAKLTIAGSARSLIQRLEGLGRDEALR